jgi:hypothetical protein
MGKYQSGVRREEPHAEGMPPIWRGIGCLLIVLVPLISFAAANLSMPFFKDQGLVPSQLLVTLQAPDWLSVAPVVAQIYESLLGRPGILATLALTIIYILFIGGLLTLLYAYMYRLAAPTRYGPMDAPPPRIKIRKYKR